MAVAGALGNGIWNSLSTAMVTMAGIVGSIAIVRSLDPQAYGVFSYYGWLAGLLAALGVLAFPSALTKIAAELRGSGAAREAGALAAWTGMRLIALNGLVTLTLLAWALLSAPPHRWYLLAIAVIPMFNALGRVLNSAFWGYENYRVVAIATSVGAALQLGAIFLASWQGWGVTGFLVAVLSINMTVPAVLVIRWLRTSGGSSWHGSSGPSPSTVRHYLAFAAPSTISTLVAAVVWQRSEVYFLERFSSFEAVGFYSLAYTIGGMFLALGWSLVNGYYPAISRAYGAGEQGAVRGQITQATQLATVFAVPLTLGAFATMPALIELLYGTAMIAAAPVANVLFAGLLPGILSGVFGLTVGALGRVWLMVKIGVGMAMLNILLDFALIPGGHEVGAAVANTGTQAINAMILYFVVQRLVGVAMPWRWMAAVAAVGSITTFALPLLIQYIVPTALGLCVGIVVAAVAYLGCIWRWGFLEPFGIQSHRSGSWSADLAASISALRKADAP